MRFPEIYRPAWQEARREEFRELDAKQLDGYQALANAIVEQAAMDYRFLLDEIRRHPFRKIIREEILEVESFFRSRWFALLTDADGEKLIRMMREEKRR